MRRTTRALLLAAVWTPSGVLYAEVPTKQELLSAWEAQWQQVHDIEVTFRQVNQAGNPQTDARLVPELTVTFRWNGTQWLCVVSIPGESHEGFISYDAQQREHRILYFLEQQQRFFGELRVMDQGVGPGLVWLADALRPIPPTGGGVMGLSRLLLLPESVLRDSTEWVDGRETAVLDVYAPPNSLMAGQVYRTVWLDIERNSVPLKEESYGLDGSVLWARRMRDYVRIDGVWLPTRISFLDGGAYSPGAGREVIVQRDSSGQPRIRLNTGLTAADCTIQFPAGTRVINADTGDSYVATAPDATPEELLDQLYAVGMQHAQRFAQSKLPARWWIAFLAAVAFGSVLGLHLSRHKAFHTAR